MMATGYLEDTAQIDFLSGNIDEKPSQNLPASPSHAVPPNSLKKVPKGLIWIYISSNGEQNLASSVFYLQWNKTAIEPCCESCSQSPFSSGPAFLLWDQNG